MDRLDHRRRLASLSPEERALPTRKCNLRCRAHLALHWGTILGIGWLIAVRVSFWPLPLPVQGMLIVFMFALLHEAIHRTVFKTRRLNDVVARVCGFYLLAEHRRCPFVTDMFENNRTTFTNLLVRLLARNMPYRAGHHAWPGVPLQQLPDLPALTCPVCDRRRRDTFGSIASTFRS